MTHSSALLLVGLVTERSIILFQLEFACQLDLSTRNRQNLYVAQTTCGCNHLSANIGC